MENGYVTTEVEIAAFLKARGQKLLDARIDSKGRFVEFEFDADAEHHVRQYFVGAMVSALELFEANRALRVIIKQLKDNSQPEKNRNERHARSY
jgi:hypothetical protein